MADLLEHALAARAAGLNVVPPREDGSKAPEGYWAEWQTRLAAEDDLRRWYRNGRAGIGLVCGAVSGGLELFELEGRAVDAGVLDDLLDLADASGLGELVERVTLGYSERTPSGGIHLLYRCPSPVTTKLAGTPEGVLIETKGEGGYVITAPTAGKVHPTGRPWELLAGGFATIATITAEEQADLHRLARSLDRMPRRAEPRRGHVITSTSSRWEVLPGDDFNAKATWGEVLEPHGWRRLFTARGGNEHWSRPGKTGGTSATVSESGEGTLFVFTSSTPFEPDTAYSKFGALAVLNHGGDYKAAAKALEERGFGKRLASGAGHPEHGGDHHPVDAEAEATLAELARGERAWPPVPEAGWNLLDVVAHFLARFVVFPSSAARDAAALWVVHTWALAAAESTPRLALLSAEKRSGKSRLLELLELVVARPMMTASISAAALFRQVEAVAPTLLIDEADTLFGKAKDDHEDLRGMLNAGHRRGAMAYRCAGPKMAEVKAYSAFAAVAMAGIGDLPSTIADRSITIRMKRRRPDEKVERFRRRKVKPEAERLVARLEAWAGANLDALTVAEPELPEDLDDRAADGWEPLLAIADAAGGDWPKRARDAARVLSADKAPEDDTAGVRLLADCRAVFGDAERLASADLAGRLSALEEAPWGAWYGHPLDARGLAKLLRRFDVRPRQLRLGEEKVRGYDRADLEDAWGRYLGGPKVPESPVDPLEPVQAVHRRSEPLFDPVQPDDVYRSHTPSDQPCTGVPVPNAETGTHDSEGRR